MLSHSGLGTPEFSSASRSALVTPSGQWVQEAGSTLSPMGCTVAPCLTWHTFRHTRHMPCYCPMWWARLCPP